MPSSDCVSAVNLIGAENGLRCRLGYSEWCTGLTGVTNNEVRTIIPYTGSTVGSNRLFAATESGIWEVSNSTPTPTLVCSFATPTGNAGYGTAAAMVTVAGHFLLYCDEVNGLHVYTESSGSWAAVTQGTGPTQIDGVNPSRLAHVAVFKNRAWFTERETANAWYLPVSQVYGTASRFSLGSVFRQGGTLVGLWNWTYDGGSGLDDSLVAISAGGDVAVYQGTDPASAGTFSLRGVWQMGAPPVSRRIASTSGGDLLLLSRQGLLPISRLVVGSSSGVEYATAKIANLVNKLMLERAGLQAWDLVQHPEDNSLLLLVPRGGSEVSIQLAQAVAGRGWFLYEELPMLSAAPWVGQLFFGTEDGRVCLNAGYLDAVELGVGSYAPVEWRLLTAFNTLGAPRQKQVQLLRPLFLSEGAAPNFAVAARYDYDQTELPSVQLVLGGDDTWDSGTWDDTLWGGRTMVTSESRGASGMGVAVRGTSVGRTVLVGVDVVFTSGGML
jgi:hypothetical protein